MSCSALLVLGIGCLAASGATGCSARSLLDLDLEVDTEQLRTASIKDPGEALLRVEVLQGGRSVRDGTSTQPLWNNLEEILTAPKVKAGFYLDDNTSGDVTVKVTIQDRKGCRIGDQKDEITVAVTPGKARSVTVTVVITGCQTDTKPDGGTPSPNDDASVPDPGTPEPDASMDDASQSTADADPLDVYCPPETGVETAMPPSCPEFCAQATAKCPQNYPRAEDCVAVCMTWPVSSLPTHTGGELDQNTLSCRALWLSTSNLGTQTEMRCLAAAVKSPFCTK